MGIIALVIALLSATTTASTDKKQLFHLTLPKPTLDAAIASFGEELDIWRTATTSDGKIKADIYVKESTIAKFHSIATDKRSLAESDVLIERDPVDTASFLAERAQIRAACTFTTAGWLENLPLEAKYVDNAFFDCWRQPDEVFSFLDTLVRENPTLISKIDRVTTTYVGRIVPGYKISTGTGRKSIYTQGLIHAREWHAGSTCYYTIAAMLDGLRAGDATIKGIFDEYDWYFVPILNLDGHLYSWSTDRYWRKNRRPTGTRYYGVDLNRNYGPPESFNQHGALVSSETYAGTAVLSEPETAGSFAFLSSLPELRGAVDLHSFGGYVLRPLGNTWKPVAAPYGAKLKAIGDIFASATMSNTSAVYVSQPSFELYLAYGVFIDSVFLQLNKTPALTVEMEGDDFVVPESAIRPGAAAVLQGLIQFAQDLKTYHSL